MDDDFTKTKTLVAEVTEEGGFFTEIPLPKKGDVVAERYEIVSVLGKGGSSVVYLCYDTILRRETALKLLVKSNAESEARLRREALLGSKWEHPNLLRLYDLGRHNSMLFVTMPVAEGGTLAEKISKKEISSFDEILKIAKEILEGLSLLHKGGFIHRDIKPSNIFFDKTGNSRLGDFGIIFSTTDTRYTSDGLRVGTPQYMSPEYLTGQQLSPSSDLWSLGITLKEAVAVLTEKGFSIPQWFKKWLSGLLQQDPQRRFQNAEKALLALNKRLTPPHILRKRIIVSVSFLFLLTFASLFYFYSAKMVKVKRVPEYVKCEKNLISAYDEDDELLWKLEFKGKINKALDWGKSSKSAGRFLVLYGGAFLPENYEECPPIAAIVSNSGKIVAEIEPLKIFNPFKNDFSEDYFHIEHLITDDFNLDGYPESLILLTHNMYPQIVCQISSLENRITGAFANSGHIYSCFVTSSKRGLKSLVLVGINNRAGHQGIVVNLGLSNMKKFLLSPDIENKGDYAYVSNYRPFGILYQDEISFADDVVQLRKEKGKELYYHINGILSRSKEIEINPSIREVAILENYYVNIRRVKQLIDERKPDEAMNEAEEALDRAPDEYLKFFAQNLFFTAFLNEGYLRQAEECMGDNIANCPNPSSASIKKGNILILQRKYKEAKDALLKSSLSVNMHPWYFFLPYSTATILEGRSFQDYFKEIKREYSEYAESSATKAFILQTAILRDEVEKGIEFEEGIDTTIGFMNSKYEDEVLFPCFYKIWRAVAEVYMGFEPKRIPSEEEVKKSFSEEREAEYKFLNALNDFKKSGKSEALENLKDSYLVFKKKSETDSSMVVPFAISAYIYGFSCYEMGIKDTAKDVLEEAIKLYPYGNLAQKAKKMIRES